MHHVLAGLVLSLLVVCCPAQQASFAPFGTACTAPGEMLPAIGATAMPRLGTTFDVTHVGPNRAPGAAQQRVQPVLLTGFRLLPAPVVVPTSVFPAQPAGCVVYVNPDVALPMPIGASGTSYLAAVSLSVPNDPRLVGATWFHQWIAVYEQCGITGCSVLWAITSDAAQAVAGT